MKRDYWRSVTQIPAPPRDQSLALCFTMSLYLSLSHWFRMTLYHSLSLSLVLDDYLWFRCTTLLETACAFGLWTLCGFGWIIFIHYIVNDHFIKQHCLNE